MPAARPRPLVDVGVGEVWLYGSVARGESEPGSDIDLVAVLDDLEYRRRVRVKSELQEVARSACGRRVEVLVTDRVEWADPARAGVGFVHCSYII